MTPLTASSRLTSTTSLTTSRTHLVPDSSLFMPGIALLAAGSTPTT
ncbi:hypothetical protein [Vulcanisaeta souniana]|nr:hypothetical protein [Vulcanisaeta souniana]